MNNIDRSRYELPPLAHDRLVELLRAETDRDTIYSVARQVRVSSRHLRRLLNGDAVAVTLPTADRIVTRLFGPELWHLDPVLREWYGA